MERLGKTIDEASWFPWEGSNDFTVSHSPVSTQLIFLMSSCPCPHQQELLFPFPPGCSGKKDAPHPWSPGVLGTATQKATNPQRGHVVLGEMVMVGKGWERNPAAPGAVKAPLSQHSWEASGMLTVGIHVTQTGWDVLHCK